jgi:hypothetical protein
MIQQIDFYCCLVAQTTNSTLSRLWVKTTFVDGRVGTKGVCWILEDGIREEKIQDETAIPEGVYDVVPIFAPSKFYVEANKIWGHLFAIGLEGIQNFSAVRTHWGVKVDDTRGCPLTGLETGMDESNFTLRRSREAYSTRVYPILKPVFDEKTNKFKVPVKWHTMRKNLLEVNLK